MPPIRTVEMEGLGEVGAARAERIARAPAVPMMCLEFSLLRGRVILVDEWWCEGHERDCT